MKRQFIKLLFFCLAVCMAIQVFAVANRLDYLVALDTGGVVTEKLGVATHGGVFDAHRGIIEIITYNVGRALQQNKLVICSAPVLRNLFTVTGDLLTPERVAWWRKYVLATDEAEKNLRDNIAALIPRRHDEIKFIKTELLPHVQKNYTVYLAKTEDLVVLLPNGVTLKQAGIVPQTVTELSFDNIERALSKTETVTISVDNLIGLFDVTNKTPKHIVLNGHGYYDIELFGKKRSATDAPFIFAQLKPSEYHRFVQLLTQISCLSLFLDSCHTGGQGVALMHRPEINRLWKLFFDVRDIPFPVIMGATTDNPMLVWAFFVNNSKGQDFDTYFSAIDRFVRKSRNNDPVEASKALKEAIGALQGGATKTNSSSIRMPGKYSFFRAISTDPSVVVLTVEDQKNWLKNRPNEPLVLPNLVDSVLLYYPSVINIPIVIPVFSEEIREKGVKDSLISPQLISMTQGKFLHTFKKIEASSLGFVDVLRAVFGTITATPHAFVIDHLTCLTSPEQEGKASEPVVFRGLCIKTEGKTIKNPEGKDVRIVKITGVRKDARNGTYQEAVAPEKFAKFADGHWYVVMLGSLHVGDSYPSFRLSQTVWKDIDAERYKKVAGEIIASTLPDKETIYQSSGAQESISMVETSAKDIVAKTVE